MGSEVLKAILFDLDNTLIDTAGAGKIAIETVKDFMKGKLDDDTHIDEICERFQCKLLHEASSPGGTPIDDVRTRHWAQAIQEVGSTCPSGLAAQCYRLWKSTRLRQLHIPPACRQLLRELRRSYKLLLLTNGEAQTQREKVAAARCRALFDAVVLCGEHGEEKPAASVFLHSCGLLGVRPSECVMVGDSLDTDIQGGVNAGLRATVWISAADCPPSGCPVQPHHTIPSVLQLPAVLDRMQ
ncbi:NANP phosphatase, partial [Amia calva]|nr:NANP phosphatase [Amia calva]